MININPTDIIVTLILIAIVGGALTYIIKAKKSGHKCIGCPHAKQCKKNCQYKNEEKSDK